MNRKLFFSVVLIAAVQSNCLKADVSWEVLKSWVHRGCYFLIKPFDWVDPDKVIEFHHTGRKERTMDEMQKEIQEHVNQVEKGNMSVWYKDDYLYFLANPNGFSIFKDQPAGKNRNKILVDWYGPGCLGKRIFVKFLHYRPFSYAATGIKWMSLAAVTGIAIEEGTKRIKEKWQAIQKKKKEAMKTTEGETV